MCMVIMRGKGGRKGKGGCLCANPPHEHLYCIPPRCWVPKGETGDGGGVVGYYSAEEGRGCLSRQVSLGFGGMGCRLSLFMTTAERGDGSPASAAAASTMFGRPEDWQKTEEGQAAIKQMREAFVASELPKYLGYLRPPPRVLVIIFQILKFCFD